MMFAAAMDASVWFLLIAGLVVAAHAGPADRGPPVFSDGDPTPKQQQKRQENFSVFPEGNPAPKQQEKRQQNYVMFSKSNSTPKKQEKQKNLGVLPEGSPNPKQQQKRQQNYEMKEVILYLTPTQIRALEAEQGLGPQQSSQADLEPLKQQIAEQIQNALNAEGQNKQNQMEKAKEADRKERLRLHEAIQNKPSAGSQQPQLSPDNQVTQLPPQNELPKLEPNNQIPQLQLSLLPSGMQLEPQEEANIQLHPQLLSQLKHQFKPHEAANIQFDPQLLEQFKQQFKLQEEPNIHLNPQALLQLKPQFKPLEDANIQLDPHFLSQLKQFKPHEDANDELNPRLLPHLKPQFISSHLPHIQPLHLIPEVAPQVEPVSLYNDKKQWHPQNYAYLYFYPKGKPVNAEHLFYPDHPELLHEERPKPIIPTEPLPVLPLHHNFELIPYDYSHQNKLEAQQILQAQLNEHHLEPHLLKEHKPETQHLSEEDIQQLLADKHLEPQFLYPRHREAYQQAQHQEKAQRENKVVQDKPEHKKQNLEAHKFDPGLDEYFKEQMKEVEEAQNLKKKIEAEEKEAHRLDAQLEEEQRKAEEMKRENEEIEYLRSITELEPKRSKMHSILKPLFQGHNIAESLEEQKKNFPHHIISMEHGFRPLQYAPKFNDEKYAREVEKILHRNLLAKQKAFATAAAIANEPPQIIETEKKEVIKHVTVPMPTPVFVPVPQPVEVKVPQPYPVPLEIVNHVPIPIMKTEKVEVEKPVPIEIEKHVPYSVMKKVYVKVDKPYFVEKVVPVEVKKEIPVEIPMLKPQKLSIIRHVWET